MTVSGFVFTGNGNMSALMRSYNWAQTPVGPVEQWSLGLRTAISICLNSCSPAEVWWGGQYIRFYNDAAAEVGALKHPQCFGRPAREGWAVVWDRIAALVEPVWRDGETTQSAALLLPVSRDGHLTQVYFTFSFSPICDEQGTVGGIFCTVNEVTAPDIQASLPQADRTHTEAMSGVVDRTTENAMKLAQGQVLQILESITDAFMALDRQWCLIYVNQEAARLFRKSREELIGKRLWQDIFKSSEDSLLHRKLQQAFVEQVAIEFEDFFSELDIWIKGHIYPSANRLSIYFRDVSEAKRNQIIRERNEIRLEEHQRLLQQVTDTVPGILYVYDLIKQQNIYINGQVAEIIGYTPEQVQAMGVSLFLRLVHPEDLVRFPGHVQRFSSLQDGEVLENEYRMRNASGEWRWFSGREIVFSRTASGVPKQILGSAYDITDRKRAEEALRYEKERFELAAIAVDCLIYDWNLETQTVERSEGLTRIFGYLPEETESTRDWWTTRIHPDDLQAAQAKVEADLATQNRYSIEYRVRDKYNQYLYVLDQGFVVRDKTGQPVRVVGTTTNISDRKITEKLQQFLIELNDAISAIDTDEEIVKVVVNKLGNCFNVSRCSYAEVDSEQQYATIEGDFCQGVDSIIGRYSLDILGANIVEPLKRGRTLVIDDIQRDPRTIPSQNAFQARHIRALLLVPLMKQERLVALLALQHSSPYSWLSEEIVVLEEVIDRTWMAIQKARAEKALRQSDARFQRLATNVPGVICRYLLHADGTDAMPYISPSCRMLFELEAETVQEDVNTLWALVHPEDVQSLREIIAISAETHQPVHWEGRYVLASGVTKWIQFVARPEATEGCAILWDGLLTDITGTKEIELEREHLLTRLQQYANQLRGLTEAALVMNSVLSVEDVLQAITEQAHSIIGAHLVVTSLVDNQNWENAIHAKYLSEKYADWRDQDYRFDGSGIYAEVCRHNRPIRLTQAEMEARFQAQNHQHQNTHPKVRIPLRGLLAAPLSGRNGQNIGLIQLCDRYEGDFTESDEAILIQLAQMASVAIENTRLYTAEQYARTQAEAANRIKDEFLAVLSHELRSPLNPILGWSRMMRHHNLDEETSTYALETIERNAKLQTQLIEDLLDVSRILQGKMSLSFCPVDLAATMRSAMETVRLAAEAKAIQIHPILQPNVGRVLGDANRLQQIVWNLLSNAVKFTPINGQIEIKLEKSDSYAQIIVSDTGKGIDPGFLPHIFEYFRQEESATTRKFGGLGLGLAIVRHIVELHGGSIQADSAGLGKGATFTVKIPLLDSSSAALMKSEEGSAALERSPSASLLSGICVLVVDDEADSREFVVYVLEQAGAVATPVASAREAIITLSKSHFDVLVSDIGMPEVDGYMLIRQVRSHISRVKQTIPAIALTAYAGEFNQQQALDAGFQYHLAKPIEPTELVTVVASLVGRSESLT